MGKETIPPHMTRRLTYNLTDKAKDITQQVKESLKKHFAKVPGSVACETKGGKVKGKLTLKGDQGVTGFIVAEVTLKVPEANITAINFNGELQGDNDKELKSVKLACLDCIPNAKRQLELYLQDFNEIDKDEPDANVPAPTDLSDASWKKFKNLTLTNTGMGKALTKWEEARKACDETATRCLKAFAEAENCLNLVALTVGKTKDAASETFHKSAMNALNAYPGLVKAAREKLKTDRDNYEQFVNGCKSACTKALENMTLLEMEVRGVVSNGVATALKECKETMKSEKQELRQKSVKTAQTILKEVQRVYKMAEVKYRESLAAFGTTSLHKSDVPKEVTEGLSKMKKLHENCVTLHKASTEKLASAIKDNE